MPKPTSSALSSKPRLRWKPAGSPLTNHPSGRWSKRLNGKSHYFGKVDDSLSDLGHDAALLEFKRRWPGIIEAGARPDDTTEEQAVGDRLDVKALANLYLNDRRDDVKNGRLAERSFTDARDTTNLIVEHLGKDAVVEELEIADFRRLRRAMERAWGPVRLNSFLSRVKAVFVWAVEDAGILAALPKFGKHLRRVPSHELRRHRASMPKKFFEAHEIRRILAEADVDMQCMVLLAVNCGLGNSDLARLSENNITGDWIDYPRPKTGEPRRCPLWHETQKALEAVRAARPKPASEEYENLVFLDPKGKSWTRGKTCRIACNFGRMLARIDKEDAEKAAKTGAKPPQPLNRQYVGIYALRHVCFTVAKRLDQEAASAILGHARDMRDMMNVYDEDEIAGERLEAVVRHIHAWLWPVDAAGEGGAA